MDQDLADALAFCNEVRAKLGRAPVHALRKGDPGCPERCALSNTINYGGGRTAEVDYYEVMLWADGTLAEDQRICSVPETITAFIFAFDREHHLALIGDGWAE